MTFRPLSETFIRRSWYSVLLDLDTMGRCHVKKAVVGVIELIAALIPIHGMLRICTGSLFYAPCGLRELWFFVRIGPIRFLTGCRKRRLNQG